VPELALLRMTPTAFEDWVRSGVVAIADIAPPVGDEVEFIVKLPGKYCRILSSQPALALIDEIEAVSLQSEYLTSEWRARLTNLGIGWIPFVYHSEWYGPPSRAEPPADTPSEVSPVGDTGLTKLDSEPDVGESDTQFAERPETTVPPASEAAMPVRLLTDGQTSKPTRTRSQPRKPPSAGLVQGSLDAVEPAPEQGENKEQDGTNARR